MRCPTLLWLGLCATAWVAMALGRDGRIRDHRWQPRAQAGATALRSYEEVEDATGPQRTIMQCLGTSTLNRACHFENVYYSISAQRFVFFGPSGATPELFGVEFAEPGEPWLRLINGLDLWKKPGEIKTQFHMDWRGGELLPPAAEVVTYSQPLHLRSAFNTRSLGHLLRDNLMGLVDLPIRFGRDPVDFDWVRWESNMPRTHWPEEHKTAQHYRGLLNNRPSVTWQQVLDQALAGASQGVKYVQFSELLGGQGPVDIFSHVGRMKIVPDTKTLSGWAQMCGPFPFAQMREVAYRNHGMSVASASDLKPFVLFLEGQPHERRTFHNAGQVIPKLKKKFPGVRMERIQISKLDLKEQLQLLSKATVVVSNIGSRSFRLIYLPNGASVVLVGPPEFAFKVPPTEPGQPATTETVPMPFQEITSCWGYIGYVSMLQYHVREEEEVHRFKEWTGWFEARDTDINLDVGKMSNLLRLALQRMADGKTFQGAGILAAYS